jgi:hypothetical protein
MTGYLVIFAGAFAATAAVGLLARFAINFLFGEHPAWLRSASRSGLPSGAIRDQRLQDRTPQL